MDDKYYFIVTHANSLKDCENSPPWRQDRCGKR
jgi:hypothetical protein